MLRNIVIVLSLIGLLVIGGVTWYISDKLTEVFTDDEQLERGDKSALRQEGVSPSKDNFSVLLLGDDARPGESGARTDAILVATFNKDEHSIYLTSIPRDMRVEIVGKSELDKINHAYAFGGIDMAINTVEQFLDIPIDYYSVINFNGLVEIVDALGGIDVDVQLDFREKTPSGEYVQFQKGTQHLNGDAALAYSRMRKHPEGGGDRGRGQRQQQVIEAMINKAGGFTTITKFDEILDSIGDNIRTNLSFPNLISLQGYAKSLSQIEMIQLQGDDARIDNIYYMIPYEDNVYEVQDMLKRHLGLAVQSADDSNELTSDDFSN